MTAEPTHEPRTETAPEDVNLPARYRQPPDPAARIRVVDAEPEHLPLIGELTVRAHEPVDAGLYSDGRHTTLADAAGRVDGATILAALFDEFVIGAVTLVIDPRSPMHPGDDDRAACMQHLAVDPSAQGMGAGRALIGACIERARAAGHHRMLVQTLATMLAANHLFATLGFEAVADTRFERAEPFDAGSSDAGVLFGLDLRSDQAH